jgi:polysaccharide biosynthesis transport protein
MTSSSDANGTPLASADVQALEPNDPQRIYGGRYLEQFSSEGSDFSAKVMTALRLLNKRKALIFVVTAAVFSLGTIRTLMTTPIYTSAIRLQIDRNVAKIVEGGNITPVEGADSEFLRTQYELLLSRSLAERVALLARLSEDQDFLRPRSFSLLETAKSLISPKPSAVSASKRELVEAAASIIQQNVSVRPVPGSRLADISYSDPNPGRSQKIASAYAEAFIASNLDKRFEANAYAKAFLEDQIKQLKLRLEQSEKTMLDFAEKEQIVAVGEASSMAETDLANSSAALGNIASERIKNEQLWKQVENSTAINFPQFLSSTAIDGLRAKRNDLVTDYLEKLQTFKPSYPLMIQINNKIAEVDRQLAAEVRTIREALKSAYQSSLNQESEITARVAKLRGDVLDFQKRSIEYNILKREVDTNRELYNGLLQRYKEVDVAGGAGSNNIFVVDAANRPASPSSPQLLKSMLLSLLLGFGVSVSLAYVLETFDDVIDSIEEAERVGGLATLGVIPLVRSDVGVDEALLDVRSPLSEAYRSLCTSLQFATARGMPKSLFVTSAGAQEGKSLSSVAIAQHFARLGLKVLIVDADMRNPSLHKYLEADNSIGLSSYLSGACGPSDAIQKTTNPNLAFMPSGHLPPNAADLLGSPHLMSLLSGSLEVFDLVIIDGPPVLGIADALLLSNAAEATAFVIGSGLARAGAVRSALKRLEISKCPLIGSVITKFDARKAGYGYGYGYSYGYGADAFSYGRSVSNAGTASSTIAAPS